MVAASEVDLTSEMFLASVSVWTAESELVIPSLVAR
jgi:hypothetical protein